ncbi:MAG: glycosyltransferase [Dehalococcoidia bacterium]|nr:glycosyltransferase [Dehalococcoidia bacterium]
MLSRLAGHSPGSQVTINGAFANDARVDVYGAFDVLVVPSLRFEGYSVVVREALAHGRPVLVSAGGALDEAVELGGVASFEPSVAGLERAITELRRPGALDALRAGIPGSIETPSRAAKALCAVYDRALDAAAMRRSSGASMSAKVGGSPDRRHRAEIEASAGRPGRATTEYTVSVQPGARIDPDSVAQSIAHLKEDPGVDAVAFHWRRGTSGETQRLSVPSERVGGGASQRALPVRPTPLQTPIARFFNPFQYAVRYGFLGVIAARIGRPPAELQVGTELPVALGQPADAPAAFTVTRAGRRSNGDRAQIIDLRDGRGLVAERDREREDPFLLQLENHAALISGGFGFGGRPFAAYLRRAGSLRRRLGWRTASAPGIYSPLAAALTLLLAPLECLLAALALPGYARFKAGRRRRGTR